MNILTFRGSDLSSVGHEVQEALGPDAMIVRTRIVRGAPAPLVEMIAADAGEVAALRHRVEPGPLRAAGVDGRPCVIALVGPTGVGKTTTLAKLAVSPAALGGRRAGALTLDTFRSGGIDQLESYAEVAGFPLEVVYAPQEVAGAVERLASECDVILVDTPGRSPRQPEQSAIWMELLAALTPDEVHLVLPAALRLEVALAAAAAYDRVGVTHLLLTKLDEVDDDAGVADAAIELRLPARWVTDGQGIPVDLHPALPRVLGALGGYHRGLCGAAAFGTPAFTARHTPAAPFVRRATAIPAVRATRSPNHSLAAASPRLSPRR